MHVHSTIKREKLYTPYLLSEGKNLVYTVCIHVEGGCFSMYMFGITHGDIKTSCSWYTTSNFNHHQGMNMQ